ncbi:MAG: V-type ATP synthase subunit D [Gammaproteobacteria bacterium]|jgi:V/A-type H+-transporting ATPase subunit D
MARLQLSKSALSREQRNLKTYQRFLPSLDLKRQQVMAERNKAVRRLAQSRRDIDALRKAAGDTNPMLANRDVDLTHLAKITDVSLGVENVVGTRLPTLEAVAIDVRDYPLMGKPFWVDSAAKLLCQMLELRVRAQVEERRLALLERAVKTITQRVNLFDKVLIPRARQNIKRIQIYLSDLETAAVVRSKISKRKRAVVEGA